jgi:serine/threonine protein kinase
MEGNLNNFKKQLKFDMKTACDLVKQLSSGLLSLHADGLCHADIKPENIL